jgi:hypothetical protein
MMHKWLMLLFLLGCPWPCQARDNKAPTVQITTPTMAATYSTASPQLLVAGLASDRVGVTRVTWSNDRGGNGVAQGTTQWSASIPLQAGANRVVITAFDAAGNQRQDGLTVTLTTPPPPPGPITIFWQYEGLAGEAFQLERCAVTPQGCPMGTLATVALAERQWTDTAVVSESKYCYRMAVLTQGQLGGYSNTLCSL